VRDEERTIIAREVHDELGQSLTGLKIDLAWLKSRMTDRTLVERVQSIMVRIDGAMDTVRRIATDLRPSILDDLGLVAAVEWQAQEFERSTGITAQLEVQATYPELDDVCATTAFRILQETLTNVARHAHATRVKITLQVSAEELTLEVRDNGRGISKSDLLSSTSLGLIGSRERAIACGGKLVIRGIRDHGTIALLRIPIRPGGGGTA
jgi:signal transduction histidine kinase